MSSSIPRDIQEFLNGYPDNTDETSQCSNLEFYAGRARCRPDGLLVDEIHQQWAGDYDTLEFKHGFIQWLFPIPEHGMNYQSQPLQAHELAAMKADMTIVDKVVDSYKLMLDFYGMRLLDRETGRIERVLPPRNWEARYRNLVRSSHNNLRISRILKCLSLMGLEHMNAGFLLHILNEQSEFQELDGHSLKSSMDRWWANCLRNESERAWVRSSIEKARKGETFTRAIYLEAMERRKETGSFKIYVDAF